ncbi:MAG: hypothetical protein JSS86_24930 [Cyanobacteria bacterium SZAS LIN-2]|nr:hypothetical protein [Cyanobacteria bacterium SZAS LIN-2]
MAMLLAQSGVFTNAGAAPVHGGADQVAAVPPAAEQSQLGKLYAGHQYSKVMEVGEKILAAQKKGSPEWLATKVLMTAASVKCQPLLNCSNLAREAYEACPTNPIAVDNYAALQYQVGDRELAGKLFEKGVQLSARDFLPHVGLSEVYSMDARVGLTAAIAQLGLAEAATETGGMSQAEKWLLIGDHYYVLNSFKLALAAYLHADRAPDRAALEGRINQSVYRSALKNNQIDLAQKLRDAVLLGPAVAASTYVLTAEKLCANTAQGEALSGVVYERALQAPGTDGEFFYHLGRAFAASGQGKYAKLSFEKALQASPAEGKYVVAYAAELAREQDNVRARRQLTELAKRYRLDEPTPTRSLAQGLARAGLALLKEYDSDWASTARQVVRGQSLPAYKTAYARLDKIKCHCRFLSMQYTLRAQPGVVFAYIPDDKVPVAFLIYDSKSSTPAAVWDKIKDEATITPLPKEESLRDFPHVVQVALDYAEAPYRPLKPYYEFNPLPLRILP